MLEVAVFDTKPYDRESLSAASDGKNLRWRFHGTTDTGFYTGLFLNRSIRWSQARIVIAIMVNVGF